MWPRLREAPLGAEPGRTMAGRALLALLLLLAQPAWAPDPVSLAGDGRGRAGPAGAGRPGAGGGDAAAALPEAGGRASLGIHACGCAAAPRCPTGSPGRAGLLRQRREGLCEPLLAPALGSVPVCSGSVTLLHRSGDLQKGSSQGLAGKAHGCESAECVCCGSARGGAWSRWTWCVLSCSVGRWVFLTEQMKYLPFGGIGKLGRRV